MSAYFIGTAFGLIFIFSLGPAFFSLVQTSVQKGFKKAVILAFGISLSDILYVVLSLMGVASLLEKPTTRLWMGAVGAVILIIYGVYSWFKKPKVYANNLEGESDLTYLKYLAKGFILNGLNPFIVVFWVGIIGLVSVNYNFDLSHRVLFFSGVLSTILVTDVLKALIAHRLRDAVTPRKILILNRSVSVILILFALQMVFFLYTNY